MDRHLRALVIPLAVGVAALAGCGDEAKYSEQATSGPDPVLPPPNPTLIPTVNIARATGWPDGAAPTPAQGLTVTAFATGLAHPRSLLVLPNGDVLVAETDAPPKPEDGKGIKGWIYKWALRRAGANTPSANRITLLRDDNGDGVAETRTVLVDGLNSPFGMALVGDQLFVANTDAIVRFPYRAGDTKTSAPGVKLVDLPAGPLNHHWTKNLIASPDGRHLYVSIGSNSNVAENGMAAETGRAAIWEVDTATGAHRIYASGLRNPNGLSWEPTRNVLWTAVNERDELGSDLVPDYMTAVKDGGFYGWPYSYYGAHIDTRVKDERPDLVAAAIVPDYALGAHTASLGLAIVREAKLTPRFADGAFVAQHGSWNRRPYSGYKVVFVPFSDGRPSGLPIDVLTGFRDADDHALGRPVSVARDGRGGLLVVDDVGNTVWRVAAASGQQAAAKPSRSIDLNLAAN
jgi:glucose/arabinose dehydrogenase